MILGILQQMLSLREDSLSTCLHNSESNIDILRHYSTFLKFTFCSANWLTDTLTWQCNNTKIAYKTLNSHGGKGESSRYIWQLVGWLLGCLMSQQQVSVSKGRICSDNFTSCHTEIQVADPTFYLTQSQYTDTGLTSPSADPITPGAWQGSHWNANFEVTGMIRPRKNPGARGIRTRDLPLSRRTP